MGEPMDRSKKDGGLFHGRDGDAGVPAASSERQPRAARKPYQRPSVQKRRSLTQATLISGGGGSLIGGSP